MVSKVKASPLLLCIALFCCLGCGKRQDSSTDSKMFLCGECGGDGKVYYDQNHPIVQLGFEPGEYDCPICGGSGRLRNE